MSMLAENRKKQKWVVDPRNTAWSNDESKIGQKMLERMGWSKGKGLGRSEQGIVDIVKVRMKKDLHGFGLGTKSDGTKDIPEDKWIKHQDDFNDLLAQLNECHGNAESQPEEQKSFSLEEKSKSSKKRVHYMKFAKGKDLSSRSATDLNCIFGKRVKGVPEQEKSAHSHGNEAETPPSLTVTSSLTMNQYFAQRMATLKAANATDDDADAPQDTSVEEPPKKKAKKKKSTKKEDEEGVQVKLFLPTNEDGRSTRHAAADDPKSANAAIPPIPTLMRHTPAARNARRRRDVLGHANARQSASRARLGTTAGRPLERPADGTEA
ncbi:PIN2/TERF1-interacting telomerase inhibitor 1 [Stigmatopora nigra]